jgi:ATP-dependent Clp protease adaptor protein ClpS
MWRCACSLGDGGAAKPPATRPATETETGTDTDESSRLMPLYRVLVHNDEVTHADFVVRVLREVFKLGLHKAMVVMITAHTNGIAHVVTVPLERAEFLVDQAHSMARARSFPLTFTYEPE